ncbi:unnamed protein product [Heterobilharzia americana]|nr:unnamed protein product [Heterobilharzia americana]
MTSYESSNNEYGNCDWFRNIQSRKSPPEFKPDSSVFSKGFLVDNRTQRFVERYFNAFYLVDVGGELENDICILRHSNTVCVVGLAFGHHIFRRCATDSFDNKSAAHHQILGLDYQISSGLNRLKNKVKGRRKHGGHVLNKSTDILAYAVCDRGVKHPIVCGIPGRLLEVNSNLDIKGRPGSCTPIHSSRSDNSIFSGSVLKLTPLIDNGDNAVVGTYLSIIMQTSKSKNCRNRKITEDSEVATSLGDSPSRSPIAPVDDVPEYIDCLDQLDNTSHIDDFIAQTSLSKAQKVLNWSEYVILRKPHCT